MGRPVWLVLMLGLVTWGLGCPAAEPDDDAAGDDDADDDGGDDDAGDDDGGDDDGGDDDGGDDDGGDDDGGDDDSGDDDGAPLNRAESLALEREGFGEGATGGDFANLYTVTTLADSGPGSLRDALESNQDYFVVFAVDGEIFWDDRVEVRSDKTVDGRGSSIRVDGTWRIEDASNVIFSDLELTRSLRPGEEECQQQGDVITVLGPGGASPGDFTSRDLWFHHLSLHTGGDGLLDIRGGTEITISWCRFHDHKKSVLAWEDADNDPAAGMRVTFHHNHWDHTSVRNPRFHFGWAHSYNNYYEEWWQYGAASYDGAQFYSEANVYQAAADCIGIPNISPCDDPNPCGDDGDWFVERSEALVSEGEGNAEGYTQSVGDLLLGGALVSVNQPGNVFQPSDHYPYTAETATPQLASDIAAGVGPRPSWTP